MNRGPEPANRSVDDRTDGDKMLHRVHAAASRIFREKGYAATSTREIAEMVGVQKASLYHHIEGKELLLFQLCVNSLKHLTSALALVVSSQPDPVERLKVAIRTHITMMLEDRDTHSTILELRSLSGERRAQVIALRDQYQQVLIALVIECQRIGYLRDDIDPKFLVLGLLNLMNWTIFWYNPSGKLSAAEIAQLLESLYIDGAIAPRSARQRVNRRFLRPNRGLGQAEQ